MEFLSLLVKRIIYIKLACCGYKGFNRAYKRSQRVRKYAIL